MVRYHMLQLMALSGVAVFTVKPVVAIHSCAIYSADVATMGTMPSLAIAAAPMPLTVGRQQHAVHK
jgi:hypothetical protein